MRTQIISKNVYRKFMAKCGIIPVSKDNDFWKSMEIEHSSTQPSDDSVKNIRRALKDKLGEKGGIYVYLNSKDDLLYVGKGACLYSRIYSHYRESYKLLSGDKKGIWNEFFKENCGRLTVLWKEVEGDRERIILEEMIECVVSSKFDKEYPRGNRKKKEK